MTDKEKKVIDKAKRIVNIFRTCNHLSEILLKLDIEELEILINLTEKQSKEIEEIKEKNIWLSEQNFMMSKRHFNDSCKIKRLDRAMTFMLQDLEVEKKGYSIKEMKKAYFSRTDKNVFLYKGE